MAGVLLGLWSGAVWWGAGRSSREHAVRAAMAIGLAASMAIMDIALDLAAPVLPPAPIAPVRQPLTVAQVQKIVITVCDSIYPQDNASYSEADSVFYGAFARAIEAEHGIK